LELPRETLTAAEVFFSTLIELVHWERQLDLSQQKKIEAIIDKANNAKAFSLD
jgi:hypothetical protein